MALTRAGWGGGACLGFAAILVLAWNGVGDNDVWLVIGPIGGATIGRSITGWIGMHAFMMASGQQTQRQTRGGDPQLAVAAAIGVILLLSRRSSELEKFESVLGHSADVA